MAPELVSDVVEIPLGEAVVCSPSHATWYVVAGSDTSTAMDVILPLTLAEPKPNRRVLPAVTSSVPTVLLGRSVYPPLAARQIPLSVPTNNRPSWALDIPAKTNVANIDAKTNFILISFAPDKDITC